MPPSGSSPVPHLNTSVGPGFGHCSSSLVVVLTDLMKHNLHSVIPILFMCRWMSFGKSIQLYSNYHHYQEVEKSHHHIKFPLVPCSQSPPRPLTTTDLTFVLVVLPLSRISCKWNHVLHTWTCVSGSLRVASEIHACHGMYPSFTYFSCHLFPWF